MERWNCCRSWRSALPGLGLGGKSFGFGFQAAVIGGIALKQNDAAIKRQHIELNGKPRPVPVWIGFANSLPEIALAVSAFVDAIGYEDGS